MSAVQVGTGSGARCRSGWMLDLVWTEGQGCVEGCQEVSWSRDGPGQKPASRCQRGIKLSNE